jgi:hypothetical protein
MIKDVLDKILSYTLEEPVETILSQARKNDEGKKIQKGYLFYLISINVSEESYNKLPTLRKIGEGVMVRENPFITYELIGLIKPVQKTENKILDQWIWAYHKILSLKSFLKVTIEHSFLKIDGALIDVLKNFNIQDYQVSEEVSRFALPVKIRLKIKVMEEREEKVKTVKERNIQLTNEV